MHWMLLPLKRYGEFRGRARRTELWMFVLFQMLVYLLGIILLASLFSAVAFSPSRPTSLETIGGGAVAVGGFFVVFGLAMLIPNLAVGVRRLHDTDRSGWWIMLWGGPQLLSYLIAILVGSSQRGTAPAGDGLTTLVVIGQIIGLIGLVGAIVLIVFYCLPGTPGPNRFGDDPLGRNTEQLAATFE